MSSPQEQPSTSITNFVTKCKEKQKNNVRMTLIDIFLQLFTSPTNITIASETLCSSIFSLLLAHYLRRTPVNPQHLSHLPLNLFSVRGQCALRYDPEICSSEEKVDAIVSLLEKRGLSIGEWTMMPDRKWKSKIQPIESSEPGAEQTLAVCFVNMVSFRQPVFDGQRYHECPTFIRYHMDNSINTCVARLSHINSTSGKLDFYATLCPHMPRATGASALIRGSPNQHMPFPSCFDIAAAVHIVSLSYGKDRALFDTLKHVQSSDPNNTMKELRGIPGAIEYLKTMENKTNQIIKDVVDVGNPELDPTGFFGALNRSVLQDIVQKLIATKFIKDDFEMFKKSTCVAGFAVSSSSSSSSMNNDQHSDDE